MQMRWLLSGEITLWALGLVLMPAISLAKSNAPAPDAHMAAVCQRVHQRAFVQPGPKVRLPEDGLLRTISSTADRGRLKASLRGEDLNAGRGKMSVTPLVHAVGVGNWIAAEELIAAGADPDRVGAQGETAFELALSLIRPDIACQLLAHGAKVPLPSPQTRYLLPAAALAEQPEDALAMVRLLLETGYPVNARLPPAHQTALHVAAETGNRALTTLLLEQHADPTLKDTKGQTALEVAQASGNREVARLIAASRRGKGGRK
jgi:uncharacterized protein